MTSRGAANRAKGHLAEKNVAAWLRGHGWPDAATTRSRLGSDGTRQPGDITGGPEGLLIEVKDRAQAAWPEWCTKASREADEFGLTGWCVIRKTARVGDPGAWMCVTDVLPYSRTPARAAQIGSAVREAQRTGRWCSVHASAIWDLALSIGTLRQVIVELGR